MDSSKINKQTKIGPKQKIDELKKQIEDFKNKYLRALADYQNFEKRVIQEKGFIEDKVTKEFLLKILPIFDDLEKAHVFVKDKGLVMIKDRFQVILKNTGVEEIQVLGRPFDPMVAEALELIEGKEDNIVKEVLRKGYMYKGKVLRVAQVKVSKKIVSR